jgi:hypothetical protein
MSSVKRIRTNDINTHYVQNAEFIDVIAGGKNCTHWDFKG